MTDEEIKEAVDSIVAESQKIYSTLDHLSNHMKETLELISTYGNLSSEQLERARTDCAEAILRANNQHRETQTNVSLILASLTANKEEARIHGSKIADSIRKINRAMELHLELMASLDITQRVTGEFKVRDDQLEIFKRTLC